MTTLSEQVLDELIQYYGYLDDEDFQEWIHEHYEGEWDSIED